MNYPKGIIKPILIIVLMIVFVIPTYSATWQRTYGGSGTECGNCVIQDSEGEIVVVGYTNSFGSSDIWLLKLDSLGDTIWTRNYGGSGSQEAYEIHVTPDNNYIACGYHNNYPTLIKFSTNGDSLYSICYDTLMGKAYTMDVLTDGGFIIAGETGDSAFMLRTNSDGQLIWLKYYYYQIGSYIKSIEECHDLGFITSLIPNEIFYPGDAIVKFDSIGNEQWIYVDGHYGYYRIKQLTNRNYIFTAHAFYLHWDSISILVLDTAGNLVNSRKVKPMFYDFIYALDFDIVKPSRVVYCGCHENIFIPYNQMSYLIFEDFSYYFGIVESHLSKFLSIWSDYPYGFVAVGKTNITEYGDYDLLIVRTDTCCVNIVEEPITEIPSQDISIFTYNTKEQIIYLSLPGSSYINLKIYDLQGRLVESPISTTLSPGDHQIPFHSERSGIYFYRLESSFGTETGKFMVVR